MKTNELKALYNNSQLSYSSISGLISQYHNGVSNTKDYKLDGREYHVINFYDGTSITIERVIYY